MYSGNYLSICQQSSTPHVIRVGREAARTVLESYIPAAEFCTSFWKVEMDNISVACYIGRSNCLSYKPDKII